MSRGEDEQTERVRNQGKPGGLFRACMDEIRSSHTTGQALRTAALAAGLLSDKCCYAELLGQFYVTTAALEKRMDELIASGDEKSMLVAKIGKVGYSFRSGYEHDLEGLLGPEWKSIILSWTTDSAKEYMQHLECASDVECAAAAFILHGPLVIGGGAMLKPRVERAFGANVTNVFEDVIGTSRGGRSNRRREFIELYDSLLEQSDGADVQNEIVQKCGLFMKLNNRMMVEVRQKPWWRKYVTASAAAVLSALVWRIVLATNSKSNK